MIKRLKYHEIDFEKYERCLENSEQRKYSGSKIFLDIMADKNWEIIVLNDYEAVMPIAYIKKFGFKIVINPIGCQQLGIFSKIDSQEINDLFLQYFKKHYLVMYYGFNDKNKFSEKLQTRKNYIIYPEKYEAVYQKYSPKRKRKLRLDKETEEKTSKEFIDFNTAKNFIDKNLIGFKSENEKAKYIIKLEKLYEHGFMKFPVFKLQKEIINMIVLYEDQKTVAALGTINDKLFIKLNGASILVDDAIKNSIEHKMFDFEGSEIPAIEEFFRGFRPELMPYQYILNSKKEMLKKILRLK